jgi:hypothetical protein
MKLGGLFSCWTLLRIVMRWNDLSYSDEKMYMYEVILAVYRSTALHKNRSQYCYEIGLTPPKNGGKFTFRGSCFHLLISPPWQPIFKNNVYPS